MYFNLVKPKTAIKKELYRKTSFDIPKLILESPTKTQSLFFK